MAGEIPDLELSNVRDRQGRPARQARATAWFPGVISAVT